VVSNQCCTPTRQARTQWASETPGWNQGGGLGEEGGGRQEDLTRNGVAIVRDGEYEACRPCLREPYLFNNLKRNREL